MSVLDKFLNAMKLNDDDGFDDEDYLDDDTEDYEEPRSRRRILKNNNDDLFDDFDNTSAASEAKTAAAAAKSKQAAVSKPKAAKISPIRPRKAASPGMEVCVIKPHTMEDAREITETLLANCTVVLNMEGLDLDIAQRIIDFASGSCYAIDGNLQKISNYIFIITPSSVDISGDFQEILTGAFDVPSFEKQF
ncbi:MAG: cell division protein SepF [Lachnospiraceae bacterium]|nr:cell division protein SepF [Lachnospiraceae bacterium]MDD3795210.1 cell division protein SepF [Lachnospiraceae bacterium]